MCARHALISTVHAHISTVHAHISTAAGIKIEGEKLVRCPKPPRLLVSLSIYSGSVAPSNLSSHFI